jgi:hypothetical protein
MIALLIISICNGAVYFYMRRNGGQLASTWASVVCPILAALGLGGALVLAAVNFQMLVGGSNEVAGALLMVILGLFVLGVSVALVYRSRKPHIYSTIGRQ